ncbi:hypothetical protein CsSME_00038846 [Camellia sinensis var. sinensis]
MMKASVQYRQQERSLGMMMKEKDDDLALFLEMRSRGDERDDLLLHISDDFDHQLGSEQDSSSISKITSTMPAHRTGADEFLNSENDKTDYDWLLTPPGTPLFPSLEMESQKIVTSQIGISNGHSATQTSMLAKPGPEPASTNNETSWQPVLSTDSNSSIAANKRLSSSSGRTSTAPRHATPTGRATLPVTTKPSRPSTPTSRATLATTTKPSRPSTPTSRATLPLTAKPSRSSTPTSRTTLSTTAKPSRPSTPTSRVTLPSTKPIVPAVRSSTPTRPLVRSSTPTARPSVPAASKSNSRSATPTHRSSTPSNRSSSVTKSGPKLKNPVPLRGTSPTVKSRPSMPERPVSASKGRPEAPSARSSSTETCSNGRSKQQSCSPSRGRALNGCARSNGIGSSVLAMSRVHSTGSDDVNPVLMGTKMVERVVNMRKLAPPKQDDHITNSSNSSGKSLPSQDNSGFGRTLSKISLDMAMRHMDIRRTIPGNLRPLVTNIPASSVYSVRSGSTKSRTVSISDSPLATSSNASSEPSVNNNSHYLDGSEEEENVVGNARGHSSSPSSLQDE